MNKMLTAIEKMSLTTKLIMGFALGLLVAAVIGMHSLANLRTLEAEMAQIYEVDLLGISHIKEANINLIYIGRALNQMMIAQDDETLSKARARLDLARTTLRNELTEARKNFHREETIARYEQFLKNFNKFDENVEHTLTLIAREKASPSSAAKFVTSADFTAAVNQADDDLTSLTKIKEKYSKATIESARQSAERARVVALLMLLIGTVLAIGLGMVIGNSIKRPNDRLRKSVEGLAGGDVATPIPHTDYRNEIGIMARAIEVLQGIYRRSNEQHWVKSLSAEIISELQQAEDFLALTQTAVSRVAPAVGAGHGAFYVADKEGCYNLLATYGCRERKQLNNCFRVGEGLVGQCVMEKSPIMLTTSKDYIRINSGLGDGSPACVMVLPVIHRDQVLGVLEMASFQQFSEREKNLLEALLPVLATSMEILDRNLRTRELLVATQEQAERMEKQAAQLEEQSVEMEAQQAELLETESWFRSIIETAPDGMLVVDGAGQILLANPKADELFGYATGELVGGQIEQLVPEQSRGSHPEQRKRFTAENRTRLMGEGPQIRGRRKDGSEFELFVTLSPLPSRGTRGNCVSVAMRAV